MANKQMKTLVIGSNSYEIVDAEARENKADKQNSNGGFAGGEGASAGAGFAGGKEAKTQTSDGTPIDAIQLGTGTNNNEKTLQVYDYTLMNADGSIPSDRLGNVLTIDELERLQYYGDKDIIPSDESYFTVNETGETITGLTDTGKSNIGTEVVIPYKINGVEITTLRGDTDNFTTFLDGSSNKVILPNTIINISDYAFCNCSLLASIEIPDSVTSIGINAFGYCDSLTLVKLPNSVTSIGNMAFSSCTNLTSINIPDSVTSIGEEAFSATSLKSIEIPDSITSISNNVFSSCGSLTSVKLSNSVTSIGNMAFAYCDSLVKVEIPKFVTNIDENAFHTYIEETMSPIPGLVIYCEEDSYADNYAKENNIPVIYTEINGTANYTAINLNETVSGVAEGLCKFSLKGSTYNGLYSPVHGSVTGKYVNTQHTLGTLRTTYDDGTSLEMDIDLYGNATNSTYGFPETRDEITETYYKRAISKDFFIKSTMEYHDNTDLGITLSSTNSKLHVFVIPASDFGEELPIKSNNIYIHNPMCTQTISKEAMVNISGTISLYDQSVGMRYIEDNDAYELYFLTLSSVTKAGLLSSKLYIKYPLQTPVYDYHVNKLLSKNSMKIIFEQESVELNAALWQPTTSQPKLDKVALISDIKAPINTKSQIGGILPLAQNINDLNFRVDNIEYQSVSVGVGDNSTDNSDIIQNLIENSSDVNTDINHGIVIPAGIYKISKTINIDKEYFTLRGEGEVIFWCTGRFPAFKIQARGVKIENIKIYLSKTEDGVAEEDDGQHSGIYIDTSKQLYDLYFKDVIIQGAYRTATKGYEYSYGIYAPPSGSDYSFAYFNTINNLQFFSVYCGICIQGGFGPVVGNFHFDVGENIYNIPFFLGTAISSYEAYSVGGCRYGAIVDSNFNNLRFTGQFIGHDSTTPTDIVYDDEDNPTKIVSCKWDFLTDCAILCSGSYNNFEGFAYDVQRTVSGYYKFTNTSKFNHYHTPYLNVNCGQNGMTFSETKSIKTSKGIFDYSAIFKAIYITDFGKENKNLSPSLAQNDLLIGHGATYAIDEDGNTSIAFPKQYGMQDNILSYLPKHGSVKVEAKTGDTWEEVTSFWNGTPQNNESIDNIDKIFNPVSYDSKGFSTGITFKQVPTEDSPIRVVLTLDKPIYSIGRMIIKFNDFIAEDYEIATYNSSDPDTFTFITRNSRNSMSQVETVFHNVQNNGTPIYVNKIIINIYKGYSTGTYNENGYVGLSMIYATAPDNGGYTWLPRGGGELYGDLDLKDNFIKLGMRDSLPEPSEEYRGKQIILKNSTTGDYLYTCIFDGSNYIWTKEDENTLKLMNERLQYYGDKDIIPSDESYFIVNETGETITGLTDTGKTQTGTLVIPYKINGVKITGVSGYFDESTSEDLSMLEGSSSITKIILPNTITEIGAYAFYSTSLESINIPDSVISISYKAFGSCNLISIDIPNSVKSISDCAFNYSSLKSIKIPNSITSINNYTFEECTSLTSIEIPNSVTSIDISAFYGCTSLKSINIPNSVTNIENDAFDGITPANLTVYCEQGSYAETYAKEYGFNIMYTDVKNFVSGIVTTITVPTEGWTTLTDTDGTNYYTINIEESILTSSGYPVSDVVLPSDIAAARLQYEAYQCINKITVNDGVLQLYCFDSLPTVSFQIRIQIMYI